MFLSFELRFQVNIGFDDDLKFFPGWKCAKLIINLNHIITSAENIFYTQP